MKKFTTLTTNDDVKKTVKKAAHMLDLAAAEKVVLDTHEESMSDLNKQYKAALDAYMQAKRSGEGWEEKRDELKKIEDASNELYAAARYSKYLIEGYKYVARLHYATAAAELVNLNAQYINGCRPNYKQVQKVTNAIAVELGGVECDGPRGIYVDGPAKISVQNNSFGQNVYLYVSLKKEAYDAGYCFRLFDWNQPDTTIINVTRLDAPEEVSTVQEVRAAAKKMCVLKQKLREECDAYQERIKKLYEPCRMFKDAGNAYSDAYAGRAK